MMHSGRFLADVSYRAGLLLPLVAGQHQPSRWKHPCRTGTDPISVLRLNQIPGLTPPRRPLVRAARQHDGAFVLPHNFRSHQQRAGTGPHGNRLDHSVLGGNRHRRQARHPPGWQDPRRFLGLNQTCHPDAGQKGQCEGRDLESYQCRISTRNRLPKISNSHDLLLSW